MIQLTCPECEQHLKVGGKRRKGKQIICTRCRSTLIIANLNPFELDVVSHDQVKKSGKKRHSVEVLCPECDQPLNLGARVHEGDRFLCNSCDAVLEVVSADPLEFNESQ